MTSWTDERVAVLRALWSEGKQVPDIADWLDTTDNAIIGKLNKLGLIGVRRKDKRDWNNRAVQTAPSAPRRFTWEIAA